jgi:large subunit ribosomal protein L10
MTMTTTQTSTGRPEPRADKVAIVEEITAKLNDSVAVFVSEYRGMSVGQLANLRTPLRAAGAEHKVYKNTLARIAATNAGYEGLNEYLLGPSALTFVTGDSVAAAKALLDQSKTNPLLVIKGGMLGTAPMSADDVKALASLPSREVLLAQLAGAFQAPLVKTAGLLQALPRNFAYGLSALIDQKAAAEAA